MDKNSQDEATGVLWRKVALSVTKPYADKIQEYENRQIGALVRLLSEETQLLQEYLDSSECECLRPEHQHICNRPRIIAAIAEVSVLLEGMSS